MSLLTLVRHGQSIYSRENRFTGNLDVDLTPYGEDEARKAGGKLKSFHYAIAFTSELKRAYQSLRIMLEETGQTLLPVTRSAAFNERGYGELQRIKQSRDGKHYEYWENKLYYIAY